MIVFRAPDDCLQYYTGSSGEFKSFNFANGIQRSLTIIFPYQSYPIMKIWANLDLDFLQANCSPARPTESASDKSLVSNFFHKKPRLSPKDTKKIISWYFSDYCAISYRASLSPSDSFEMLTCEKQSSSFNHGFLMNLAEHHHDLPDECPHHPDLVFNKHFDKTWLSNITVLWKRCLHTDFLLSKQWYDDDGGKLQDSVRQRSRWWGHWGQRQQSCQVT